MIKRRGRPRFTTGRDPTFLAWIREQPCWVCGAPAEPAHLKSRGAGGVDRGNVIPLCRWDHREQHQMGIQSFGAKYGVPDLAVIGADYARKYENGRISHDVAPGPTNAGDPTPG